MILIIRELLDAGEDDQFHPKLVNTEVNDLLILNCLLKKDVFLDVTKINLILHNILAYKNFFLSIFLAVNVLKQQEVVVVDGVKLLRFYVFGFFYKSFSLHVVVKLI